MTDEPRRVTILMGADIYEFLVGMSQETGESLSHLAKWFIVVGANAVCKTQLQPPRKPGGMRGDPNDPEVKRRLREQAARMRKARADKRKARNAARRERLQDEA